MLPAISGVAYAEPVVTQQHDEIAAIDPVVAVIAEASQRFGIPESWIRAVMQVESGGDVRALSPMGAMGLMQIMPQTWSDLRQRYGLGDDPYDTHDNVLAGTAYLKELYDRFGSPGFLAAYNCGPERYDDFLATGRKLPDETLNYVAVLAPMIDGRQVGRAIMAALTVRPWTAAPLFVAGSIGSSIAKTSAIASTARGTSVGLAGSDRSAMTPQSGGLFVVTSLRNQGP